MDAPPPRPLKPTMRSAGIIGMMPTARTLAALLVAAALAGGQEGPAPIAPDRFDALHRLIRVQPDEQRFWQIAWKLSISDAREEAAREGKPILVWAGAGGAPIGVC